MALSLESLRNLGLTTIFGRRLALDASDFLVGPKGMREQVEDLTTTPTTVANHGLSRVTATGSSQGAVQHFLPAPVVGGTKRLSITTTSTGSHQFLSTANGASVLAASDGTTKSLVNLIGPGGAVTLFGVTTAAWQVIATVGGVSYTTST
jgi:hypothetical protein